MSFDNLQQIETRLADLKRKLKAREGKPAFKDNVPALQSEIARMEKLKAFHEDDGA